MIFPDLSILTRGTQEDVFNMWRKEIGVYMENSETAKSYRVIALLDESGSIDSFELNRMFRRLKQHDPEDERPLLLILVSPGGEVEPAYQIAKICRKYSHNRLVIAIPRIAKSAATLISLGADEIHMGELGQLGPIDLQLNGIPAAAIRQALTVLRDLAKDQPSAAVMFAQYLRASLSVEQIGFSDRVAESVEQYATRLLSRRKDLPAPAEVIASKLAQAYKNHRFVIDEEEARELLGENMVRSGTPEADLAENIYEFYNVCCLFLSRHKYKLHVCGDLYEDLTDFPIDTDA